MGMSEVRFKQRKPLAGKGRIRACHSRRGCTTLELERLKRCLLHKQLSASTDPQAQHWMRRAADEAASIAWATTHPLLVFPVLLEEKLSAARRKAELQRSIYLRSQAIISLAA